MLGVFLLQYFDSLLLVYEKILQDNCTDRNIVGSKNKKFCSTQATIFPLFVILTAALETLVSIMASRSSHSHAKGGTYDRSSN